MLFRSGADLDQQNFSALLSTVEQGASGNAGKIVLHANSLQLENGGGITSRNDGIGSGGSITLDITGALTLTGFGLTTASSLLNPTIQFDTPWPSRIESSAGVNENSQSIRGGDIQIYAGSLLIKEGASLSSSTHACIILILSKLF